MPINGVKFTTVKALAAGASSNRIWNNAKAAVYHLNAWPVVPAGAAGSVEISRVAYVVHGSPTERELHYTIKNTGAVPVDVEVWALVWTDPGETWTVRATHLHANKVQEDSGFPTYNDDEFYVGLPWLRSTPGVVNSTSADFSATLSEIEDIDPGNVRAIPSAMGTVTFHGVKRKGMAHLLAGQLPEVLVVVSAAFESDATPFGEMTSQLKHLASSMKTELGTNIIEKLSATTSASSLKAQLATATTHIQQSLQPSFWEALRLWLASWTDPDDPIGFKTTLFVAADDSLWAAIKPILSGAGSSADVRQLKNGDGFSNNYVGDDANYTLDFSVARA